MSDLVLKRGAVISAVRAANMAQKVLSDVAWLCVPVKCRLRVSFRSGFWAEVEVTGHQGAGIVRVRNLKTKVLRAFDLGDVLSWEFIEQEEGGE